MFVLHPGLLNIQHNWHGDGVGGHAVVVGHVHLREHSDVVDHELRRDEGLVPTLLFHHASHAQADAG